MVIDSGDLKSRVAFSPYLCQFVRQTRRYHESWSDSFRAVVGFCSIQSLRTFGRSLFIESRSQTLLCMESFPLHDVLATHSTRRLARSCCLSQLSACQALSHWYSQQSITFYAGRCERKARLATIRGAWSSTNHD